LCLCLISSEYMHQQLRKEGRRNENEMQKILASNQRLKMVNSRFLYDIINLLLTETTFLFSFFFFGVLLLDNYFSYILVFFFLSGFTTKNRRSFHVYKTAKRAFRISKSFIAQISWLGDLLFHFMFVFHNYNTLTVFFFWGHVGARGGNIPRIQVFNSQIGRIRLYL
jgi:hypothetical protein